MYDQCMIPEFQDWRGSQHLYCEKCGREMYGLSVISVHNLRRHEWVPDVYGDDYLGDRECRECGSVGFFQPYSSENDRDVDQKLIKCSDCGALQ